jgi:hypothetical protein
LSIIAKNPINAPYHLVQLSTHSLSRSSLSLARAGSVVMAMIVVFCFFYILKYWFGSYIASLGAVLLAGTPLFIILARSATPAIMLFSPLIPVAIFFWLQKTKKYFGPVLVLLAFSAGIAIYTPGIFWLVLLAIGLCYSQVVKTIGRAGNVWMGIAIAVFVIIIAPLAWVSATNTHIAQATLLLPSDWQSAVELGKSAILIPASLIWQARFVSDFYIARLPLVNFSVLVFALFGIYAMLNQAKREAAALLALLFGGCILAIINNSVLVLGLVLPILIIFSAAGLRYLYVEWQTVFPKNPIPQALAIILMVLVVGQYFIYGLNYAHYAWPHTQRTKLVYVIK